MLRRKATGRHQNSLSPFSAKLICGDYGGYYGSKVWHSNSKYRRTIWQCNGKFKGVEKCRTPHLYEDDIKAMFLKAVSELMIDREALIDDGRVLHTAFTDFNAIDKEVAEITSEIDVLSGLVQKLVDENASTTLDRRNTEAATMAISTATTRQKSGWRHYRNSVSFRSSRAIF